MNLPNKLTVLRIILTPVFMLTLMWNFKHHYLVSLIIFAFASFTDFLDGKIARKHNLITDFGKFLDPLADKMLTTAAFLGFILNSIGWQITWIVFIVLFREFLIASLRLVVVSSKTKKVIAANIWGKAKTVSQMLGIIIALLLAEINGDLKLGYNLGDFSNPFGIIISVVLWIGGILCIISGVKYLLDNKEAVDPSK